VIELIKIQKLRFVEKFNFGLVTAEFREYCEMNTVTAQAFLKKTISPVAAFVLAVIVLTAAVPFILSERVGAISSSTAVVTDEASFVAAAADPNVTMVSITASFTTAKKIVFSGRDVYIDGNGNKVSFIGDTPYSWQGNYVIQAYKNTLGIKNLSITGGDAAIYANGATLNLEGIVDVSGNDFGGIEVSQGSNVATPAILNAASTLVNTTEANTKPTAWIDRASTTVATVNGNFVLTTHIGTDQKQYYLNGANTGTVATNTTHNTTFATFESAIAAAGYGDTIELNKDIFLSSMPVINKGLKIDGLGHTVTALYSYTVNGLDNAVLTVNGNDVSIKNLTTDNVSAGQKPHGISVYNARGVMLEGVTLKNGRAGATIVGSSVIAKNIHTINNTWGGINVDRNNAELTISGSNTHNDIGTVPAIWVDDRATATVVDVDKQYSITPNGVEDEYMLRLAVVAPVVTPTPISTASDATVITVDPPLIQADTTPGFPQATSPVALAEILGNTSDNANSGAGVEGTSTENKNTLTGTVNSEANKGTFLGVSWYWWILILAAIATVAWWIMSAARNRQAE